jgi:MYXO-CTERM domain-containing protein
MGQHSFQVRARDVAGNADPSPASHTWTVTTGTSLDTSITAGPPAQSSSASATFTFNASVAGASFECSLDGAAFSACTSPATYTPLAQGQHTFQVRARDTAGNVDPTPASYSWTIDEAPPEAPVIRSPANGATVTDMADEPDTADEPAAPKGSGCSAGPGDSSWMLASLALLAGLAARRRRFLA